MSTVKLPSGLDDFPVSQVGADAELRAELVHSGVAKRIGLQGLGDPQTGRVRNRVCRHIRPQLLHGKITGVRRISLQHAQNREGGRRCREDIVVGVVQSRVRAG